jgi:hypothetical protein
MTPFRMRQPWVPWWIALPMLSGYVAFGWVLVRDFNEPGQMVRIILPAYVLLGAIVLPAAMNRRFITVSREGVRVVNGPIPKGRNVSVAGQDIRSVSIRTQYAHFDSEAEGSSASIAHYLVGVEATSGHIDIAYPYLKYESAASVARQIAAALGNGLSVTSAGQRVAEENRWTRVRKILVWLGLFLLAIFAGAYWETRSSP